MFLNILSGLKASLYKVQSTPHTYAGHFFSETYSYLQATPYNPVGRIERRFHLTRDYILVRNRMGRDEKVFGLEQGYRLSILGTYLRNNQNWMGS